MAFDFFRTPLEAGEDWREEIYRDYHAPFIIHNADGQRQALLGSYGFVPKRRLRPGEQLTTMNARAETVGQLRTYKGAWASSRLCLVPMRHFYEPNWEQHAHVRWAIGMADEAPFAVAGIYRAWEEEDGSLSHSFTQLTINADEHALMNRFHKKDDEKRSLVIIPQAEYDNWLSCRNPEAARAFLQPYPAELMAAYPAPKLAPPPKQAELF
ncbi:SOS response-associated peptidase family protein [Oxalobacteraceae bacterium]|nr:SOS response-associated peptidase family protein [Oxalobacteraceae bacterium]